MQNCTQVISPIFYTHLLTTSSHLAFLSILKCIHTVCLNLALLSMTPWNSLQYHVAEILDSLIPCTSRVDSAMKKKGALPFNQDPPELYNDPCSRLKPFVILEILNNGKLSKCKMKILTFQVFDKDTMAKGCLGGKTAKVRNVNECCKNVIN